LLEVVDVLPGVAIAVGEPLGERQVAFDQRFPIR
jgi:hypothetical protein